MGVLKLIYRDLKSNYYRHFKGRWYELLCIAEFTEEADFNDLVVYRALYGEGKRYARPLRMFKSKVNRKKYPGSKQEYRFMSVDELEKEIGKDRVLELFNKENEGLKR